MKRMTKWMMVGIVALALNVQAATISWYFPDDEVRDFNSIPKGEMLLHFFLILDGYEDALIEALYNETFNSSMDGILNVWTKAPPDSFVFGETYDTTITDAEPPFAVRLLMITEFLVPNYIYDGLLIVNLTAPRNALDGIPFNFIYLYEEFGDDFYEAFEAMEWVRSAFVPYTPIPEPLTTGLALAGVALLIAQRRRKK